MKLNPTEVLYHAILSLEDARECDCFFDDLLTAKEQVDLSSRLDVARRLAAGENYNDIAAATGASTATISRVSKCLSGAGGGYRLVLSRLHTPRPARALTVDRSAFSPSETLFFSLRELYSRYGYRHYEDIGHSLYETADVTLSILADLGAGEKTEKLYYHEALFRTDREGNSRRIRQSGVDCIGTVSLLERAEILSLALKTLAAVSSMTFLSISHSKLLDAFFDDLGIYGKLRMKMQTLLSKKDKNAAEAALEAADRMDAWERLSILFADAPAGGLAGLERLRLLSKAPAYAAAVEELYALFCIVDDQRIRLDFAVDASLYYSGLSFVGCLSGRGERLLRGGSYDPLAKRIGRREGGIGFALYLDVIDDMTPRAETDADEICLLFSPSDPVAEVYAMAEGLREQGARVHVSTALPVGHRFARVIRFGM